MGNNQQLILHAYDPSWVQRFETAAADIRAAMAGQVLEVEHIGSTSVPGMVGKPVIDLLVGVRTVPIPAAVIAEMRAAGYRNYGEYGIPFRSYFSRPDVHVHCFEIGEGQWDSHLLIRDYLRAVPAAREAYVASKYELYMAGNGDLEYYSMHKEFVVDKLLIDAYAWHAAGRP